MQKYEPLFMYEILFKLFFNVFQNMKLSSLLSVSPSTTKLSERRREGGRERGKVSHCFPTYIFIELFRCCWCLFEKQEKAGWSEGSVTLEVSHLLWRVLRFLRSYRVFNLENCHQLSTKKLLKLETKL